MFAQFGVVESTVHDEQAAAEKPVVQEGDLVPIGGLQASASASGSSEVKAIQEAVKLSQEEIKAGQTLAKHYRAKQARRSFKRMQDIAEIDVPLLARKNFGIPLEHWDALNPQFPPALALNSLLGRLKFLEGDLTPEMKNCLMAKKIGKNGFIEILTLEEKEFVDILMKGDWKLKHVTRHHQAIKDKGNQLLSIEERRRRGIKIDNSNTHPMEGHSDNVFFSFGPGEIETARFLDSAQTVITIDYKEWVRRDAQGMGGLWSSDHFFAYRAEQKGELLEIYGVKYKIDYQKEIDEKTGRSRWIKVCHFYHPDGSHHRQVTQMGGEIFRHPQMDLALALMTIEKVRLLGLPAWQKIMREKDVNVLQSIVQTFFHTGTFEVHQPTLLSLNSPEVSVLTRLPAKSFYPGASSVEGEIETIKAILKGDCSGILKTLEDTDINLDAKVDIGGQTFTLLGAAIIAGQSQLVQRLLAFGVDVSRPCLEIIPKSPKSAISYKSSLSPIACVVFLSNPKKLNDFFKNTLPDVVIDCKSNAKAAREIVELLVKRGASKKTNPNIRFVADLEENSLKFLIRYFEPAPEIIEIILENLSVEPKKLPLAWAVSLRSISLLQLMVKKSADVNARIEDEDMNSPFEILSLPVGFTPLLAAVFLKNEAMVRALLVLGANPEIPFIATPITVADGQVYFRRHAFTGYTPHDLAEHLGERGIAKVLKQAIKPKKQSEEKPSSFATGIVKGGKSLIEKSFSPKPQNKLYIEDRRTFVVFTGHSKARGKFFVTVNGKTRLFPFLFAFMGHSTETFVADILQGVFFLNVKKEQIVLQHLANFSHFIPELETHIEAQLVAYELTSEYSQSLVRILPALEEDGCFIVYADELKVLASSLETKEEAEAARLAAFKKEKDLTEVGFGVLILLSDQPKLQPFTAAAQEALALLYQRTLKDQYRLTDAAKKGDSSAVHALLQQGVLADYETSVLEDVSRLIPEKNPDQVSIDPLNCAIAYGQYACAELLVDNIPESRVRVPKSLLDKIVKNNQLVLYQKLRKKREPTLHVCEDGFIWLALEAGSIDILEYLLFHVKQQSYDSIFRTLLSGFPHEKFIKILLHKVSDEVARIWFYYFLDNQYVYKTDQNANLLAIFNHFSTRVPLDSLDEAHALRAVNFSASKNSPLLKNTLNIPSVAAASTDALRFSIFYNNFLQTFLPDKRDQFIEVVTCIISEDKRGIFFPLLLNCMQYRENLQLIWLLVDEACQKVHPRLYALREAANSGDLEAIQAIVDSGVDINTPLFLNPALQEKFKAFLPPRMHSITAFNIALFCKHESCVLYFLNQGVKIDNPIFSFWLKDLTYSLPLLKAVARAVKDATFLPVNFSTNVAKLGDLELLEILKGRGFLGEYPCQFLEVDIRIAKNEPLLEIFRKMNACSVPVPLTQAFDSARNGAIAVAHSSREVELSTKPSVASGAPPKA